jgi:hypothetical protein
VRIRWKPEALAYRVRHTARADLESNGGQPEFSGSNGLRVNGRVDPLFDPGMNQLSSFRDFLRKLLLTPAACVYATPTVTNFIKPIFAHARLIKPTLLYVPVSHEHEEAYF